MSLSAWKQTIADGDLVIFYENYNKMSAVSVKAGQIFNNRFGHFSHSDLIGKPFGTRLYARKGAGGGAGGFVTCLHPTAELWTQSLRHRTQILYQADISMILLGLNIKPGSVVVESGTGSGSLSTSFVRSAAPNGHVHTFEFNAERVKEAKEDFARTGISSMIDVYHRNVCARGFPLIEGGVDAVFLDLPTPWEVVDSAKRILVPNGRFCSFSPCIEQVQRTCLALRNHGFTDIHTIECLLRTFDVTSEESNELPPFDASLLRAAGLGGSESADAAPKSDEAESKKRALDLTSTDDAASDEKAQKRRKTDSDSKSAEAAATTPAPAGAAGAAVAAVAAPPAVADSKQQRNNKKGGKQQKTRASSISFASAAGTGAAGAGASVAVAPPALTIKPFPIMRGHTGYLTFAVPHHLPDATTATATAAAATAKK